MNKPYQLTSRDKEWIFEAIDREFSRLQIKKKLQESNYTDERLNAYLDFYDIEIDKKIHEEGDNKVLENEPKFEENVKKYQNKETRNEMSWSEKRQVKKFIKEIEKYSKILKTATEMFKKELEYFDKQDWSKGKVDEELKHLKHEIIDRIIEAKVIIDIPHPKTGEEVTKENMKNLNIDELILIIEENVNTLDLIVNGKITE